MTSNMNALLSALQNADSVLLFCHVSPDGDTLGSALALSSRLRRMDKRAMVVMDDDVPTKLCFLPGVKDILKPSDVKDAAAYSLGLAVDVPSRDRLGASWALFSKIKHTALIDHHPTNLGFAELCVIDGDAPATAIVADRLLSSLPETLSHAEAICLYTALATDTGNFIYKSTNAESFRMMARLMEAGLPLDRYSRLLFRQKELGFVKLLSAALPTLRVSADGRLAGLYLTREHFCAACAEESQTDGIVDYALDIEGVRLAYFAKETADGCVKMSLRALDGDRVDEVASAFGGGGHQLAAGCTLNMPLAEAIPAIEHALALSCAHDA